MSPPFLPVGPDEGSWLPFAVLQRGWDHLSWPRSAPVPEVFWGHNNTRPACRRANPELTCRLFPTVYVAEFCQRCL